MNYSVEKPLVACASSGDRWAQDIASEAEVLAAASSQRLLPAKNHVADRFFTMPLASKAGSAIGAAIQKCFQLTAAAMSLRLLLLY
jgi:hypothetical protein